MKPWFTDIRKAALLALFGMLMALPVPLWDVTHSILQTLSDNPSMKAFGLPMLAVGFLLTAIEAFFYYALYRNQSALRFSERIKKLSLAAAVVVGALAIPSLWNWLVSLSAWWNSAPDSALFHGGQDGLAVILNPTTIHLASGLVSTLGWSGELAILLAISSLPHASQDSAPSVSKQLRIASRMMLIVGGLITTMCLLQMVGEMLSYSQMRMTLLQYGQSPAIIWRTMGSTADELLTQLCLLVAPYAVYKSLDAGADQPRARPVKTA